MTPEIGVYMMTNDTKLPAIFWASSETEEQTDQFPLYIRAECADMPAMLILERPTFGGHVGHSVNEALVGLRMKHWQRGPLAGTIPLEPIEVSGRRFARTVFEVESPRRSTILAAATEYDKAHALILQLAVAGVGRVRELLDQLFEESIEKALEVVPNV